jgi:uncharacterized membrane protein YeaQ/YmgE (transglycosylase-associated protein family)
MSGGLSGRWAPDRRRSAIPQGGIVGFWIWMIIVSLIAGVIFGPLARLVLPGKQNISLGWTILGGGIGAFLGGLIAYFLGVKDTSGPDWIQYLIQIICAAIVVAFISSRNSKAKV